jgi:hypothetical protein
MFVLLWQGFFSIHSLDSQIRVDISRGSRRSSLNGGTRKELVLYSLSNFSSPPLCFSL